MMFYVELFKMQDEITFYQNFRHVTAVFPLDSDGISCQYIYTIRNYWQFPPYLVMLSENDLCFVFFSFYVFHIGWTLMTKQLLKHLKIFFLFYHSRIIRHPLSSTI